MKPPTKAEKTKKYKRMSREVFKELPGTKVIPNKKRYKRKPKHRKEYNDD